MHKAINAKFKKGDKVVWVSQGKRGVVTNPYAKGEYAVRFEGDRNDTWIAEEKLRAANCEVAANAKFRVGQLVKHTNGDTGVITVVNPANGFGDYQVRIVAGHGGFRGISSWDEEDLSVANCATTNAVVAKAVANARAANSTDAAEATVAKNALTSGQYKEIYDSLCDADTDADKCAEACKKVSFILGDINREIGDMSRKYDKEADADGRAIEASIMACYRAHGTLATAVAAMQKLVARMSNKYADYDPKRLIDG